MQKKAKRISVRAVTSMERASFMSNMGGADHAHIGIDHERSQFESERGEAARSELGQQREEQNAERERKEKL